MNASQNTVSEENRRTEASNDNEMRDGSESGIGMGKKVGLYGCGFLVLAVILVFVVLALTGFNVPFQGTEGVGP